MTSRDFNFDGVEREKRPSDVRGECARAALALTAMFDGEANHVEACLAESHLESCARCAWLWQSWTRSRYLLRRLPMPEVPPGLLMRVLLAVRLMSFSQNVAKRAISKAATPATNFEPQSRDARLLAESVFVAGANPFAPRLASASSAPVAQDLPPLDAALPQPPADLCARILSQTITAPTLAPISESKSEVASPPRRRPLWTSSKTFSSALLPAAAAWLFLVARAPQLAETPVSPAAAPSLTSPSQSQTRPSQKPVASRGALNEAARLAATLERTANTVSPVREAAAPRFMAAMNVANEVPAIQPAMAWQNTAPAPAVSAAVLPQPPVMQTPRRAPAISVAPATLRARHALWNAPNVPTPDERATQWHVEPRHAMPSVAGTQPHDEDDEAPDAAEILDHGARLTDNRPNDVADVVDDFRASLMAAAPDDAQTGDGENG